MNDSRYDLRVLGAVIGAQRSDSIARRLGVNITRIQEQLRDGITRATAEEYCEFLKIRPDRVWPGWDTPAPMIGAVTLAAVPPLAVAPEPDPLPDGMVFEDPPESSLPSRAIDWGEVLAPLRGYPNRWVRVRMFSGRTSAGKLPGKLRVRFPEFEVRSTKHGSGSALYVRFRPDRLPV